MVRRRAALQIAMRRATACLLEKMQRTTEAVARRAEKMRRERKGGSGDAVEILLHANQRAPRSASGSGAMLKPIRLST